MVDISEVKSIVGFVPQDDIVHEDLTVREQIQISARLRNESSLSDSRIKRVANDVLNVMQIDHIQNSIVGGVEQRGISGGQRKRVNIGLELAAQPTVLFLDEPTSGLDSTSSLAVAFSLKKMCELGMTSIMVIHQPRYSLFTLFDDVLLLGKGGQTVYLGPSLECKAYFESLGFVAPDNENPADWFMDIISGEVLNEKIPDFKPHMLFELWEKRTRDGEFSGNCGSPGRVIRSGSRLFNYRDDMVMLAQSLNEAWDKIDTNRDGFLQEEELRALLGNLSGLMPDDMIVHELFMRMAGEDAIAVTKEEFLDFLGSLQGDIARDRLLDAQSPGRAEELDGYDIEGGRTLDPELSEDSDDPPGNELGLNREAPGYFFQLRLLLRRSTIQWYRKNPQRLLFLCVLAGGALILAIMDEFILDAPHWSGMSYLNTQSALALMTSLFCLQLFGSNRPVFWRERSRGLNVLAHYQANLTTNAFDSMLQVALFTSIYFLIRQPPLPYGLFLAPYALVTYVASGWGFFISTIVPPEHGPFVVSLIVFITCGLLGNPQNLDMFLDGGWLEFVVSCLSITRWSAAMSFNLLIETEGNTNWVPPQGQIEQATFELQTKVFQTGIWEAGTFATVMCVLFIMGTVLRVLGFLGLYFQNRDRAI